jgi:hypothetical protein
VRLFADAFWFYMWVSQPANYSTPTKTINNVIVLISCIAVMSLWFRVAKMYKKSDGDAAILSILFGFPILNIILAVYFAYFNKDGNLQKPSPVTTQPIVTTTPPITFVNSTSTMIPVKSTKPNEFYSDGSCRILEGVCSMEESVGSPVCDICKIAKANTKSEM